MKKMRKEFPRGGGEELWAQLGLLTRRRSAQSPGGTPLEHCALMYFLGGFYFNLYHCSSTLALHKLGCCCSPEGTVNVRVAPE